MTEEILCCLAREISIEVARRKFRFQSHEAEDVAQEMALRTLIRAHSADVTPAWIYTGATFFCIDLLRKNGRHTRVDAYIRQDLDVAETIRNADDERLLDLRRALRKLSVPAQRTLWLYFWEGRTWAEIDEQSATGKRASQYRVKKSLALLSSLLRTPPACRKPESRV